MKITKFEHACVLIQDDSQKLNFLVDPGIYAWESGNVDLESFPELAYVIVTHIHGDHLAESFVKAIVDKFPNAEWIAPSDTHEVLKSYGVGKLTNQTTDSFEVIEGEHAVVTPFGVGCKNLVVHYLDKLTIVGDTLDIAESKDVLLLPVQAPWGTTVNALALARSLAPKYVIPVHDWMWNKEWKDNVYDRFETSLAENNSKFVKVVNGQPVEIDL